MNKISCGQFAAMLLITDAFSLICLMGNISVITAVGFLIGIIIQAVISLPTAYFYKKNGTLKNVPKILLIFYLICIILRGGQFLIMLCNTADVISIMNYSNAKLLIIAFICVCIYISSSGIRAISRASLIAAALGTICTATVILSAVFRMKSGNLSDTSGNLVYEIMRGIISGNSAGSMIVFLGMVEKNPLKCLVKYFTGKAVLGTAVILSATASVGGIMTVTNFPVITAAQLSQPFSSQRIDSVFLIFFIITAVFSISVQTTATSYLIGDIFPSFDKFRNLTSLLLIISSAVLVYAVGIYSYIWIITCLIPLTVISRKV
jgi:hypothetical protein